MLHPGYDTIPRPLNTSQVRISRTNMDWPKLDWFRAVATVRAFVIGHVRFTFDCCRLRGGISFARLSCSRESPSSIVIFHLSLDPKYFRMFSRHEIGGEDFMEDDKSNVHFSTISISFFFACFFHFFLRIVEEIGSTREGIIPFAMFVFNANAQNSRAYSFPPTFERVWVRLTRGSFSINKNKHSGAEPRVFFPQTTIKRGEREGEIKNRMEKKRQTNGGRRERARDKRNSRNIYLEGFILRSRLFYFGHAFLGQFFSNRSDAVIRDSMHAGDSTSNTDCSAISLSLSLFNVTSLRNTPDLSVFIS